MFVKLKFLLALVMFLTSVGANAQGHTFKECRLSKNWMKNTEGVSCPACNEKTKKEKEARAAEQKQRDIELAKKIAADNLAKKKAFEAEQARKRAEAAKPKSGEVVINAQRLGAAGAEKKSTTSNYTVSVIDPMEPGPHLCQIKKDGKVVFETRDYQFIDKVGDELLFVGRYYDPSGCRNDPKKNNSILFDITGKKVVLGGLERFGFLQTSFQDSTDHFEIVVYSGDCDEVYNDTYDKSRWPTTRYKFSFTTRAIVGTENSAQNGSCSCGEY